MAFGTDSKMFVAWAQAVMGEGRTAHTMPASYAGLTTDTVKVALYGNSGTPDNTAERALTGYAAATSAWVTGNEVTDSGGSNWPAGGQTLASKTLTVSTSVLKFDGADLAGGGNVTISDAYGCLVYDDTITSTGSDGGIADQGVCYNSFGSGQSVTAGTFTIVWNSSGIFTVDVSGS